MATIRDRDSRTRDITKVTKDLETTTTNKTGRRQPAECPRCAPPTMALTKISRGKIKLIRKDKEVLTK